jgi:hypothetical protein
MAGDWLKVEKDTPDKPEVLMIAVALGITPDEAFAKCFRFWRWADSHTADGTIRGASTATIDALVGCKNFSEALKDVGWLRLRNGRVLIPEFERHMGESAKQRALTARRVANHRAKKRNDDVTQDVTQDALAREEHRRHKENHMSMGIRKHQVSATTTGLPDAPPDATPDAPRMPIVAGDGGRILLTDDEWDHVVAMAEAVARKIPPTDTKGRRCWFKYAALAEKQFGEGWLMDAVAGVLAATSTKSTRQGHFVGILRRKAEEQWGINAAGFRALMKRIEVPPDVWHLDILEIRK